MEVYDYAHEKAKKKIKGKIIIAATILLVLIAAVIALSIYLEVLQLDEIGNLSSIYLRNLTYQVISFLAAFIIIFCVVSAVNVFIGRNLHKYCEERGLEHKKFPSLLIALVIALIGALIAKNVFYLKALSYFNWSKFGTIDPIFHKDIGYYIFQRPFLMSLYNFFSGLWIFIIIYTALCYIVVLAAYNTTLSLEELKVKSIIRHNLLNIALFFLIKAFSYKFMQEGILYSTVVNWKGASYIDVHVWKLYYTIAPFLLLLIVAGALFSLWKDRVKRAAFIIAIFPVIWLITALASVAVQELYVAPNVLNLESKYIQNNIAMTRKSFGLDKISTYQFANLEKLTPDIINSNIDTKNNIRVIDYNSTLLSDIQLQSNTQFYSFKDGDIINYNVNGKETPVFITAREIDKSRIQDQSYINMTYKYTHGYGVVINPINYLSSSGQPGFILSDLRLKSVDPKLKLSEPRIYYGENTNDYVIVNANGLDEIDYDGTSATRYKGQGGITLNGINRLLFTLRLGDIQLITSGYASNARLLINREIISRAQKAVPFLTVDRDPYVILTSDGRLKWVLDAYTTSELYPNAQSYGTVNYIRNSVKIVIDAYDGKVKYYVIDKEDPIIKTYSRIYPGIFSEDPLPADIKAHMRYPELLFSIQTEMLKAYHVQPQEVSTFYEQQDRWDVAKYSQDKSSETLAEIEPYYNMIKLPEEIGKGEELVLMRPFTPSGGQKHNMVSWLAVRNSSENYGQMILFRFPKYTNIFGPNQVEVKINQIDSVSKDMTLWGQSGSTVYKGNLLVIPIKNSILYVEPIYIKAQTESSIPEVREIVVGYQDGDEFRYGIGTNLDKALSSLFGTTVTTAATTQTTVTEAKTADKKLLEDIMSKYDELKKQIDDLGSLINKLQGTTGGQ